MRITASGSVTVRLDETGQTWTININANTVLRPKSAVSLVLDHYGWVGFATHEMNLWRVAGAVLLVAGVVLIVRN